MAQLFRHMFHSQTLTKRIKLSSNTFSADLISKELNKYTFRYDPKNELALHRMPKQELYEVASVPCPTSDSIESAKALRKFTGVPERKVCQQCPLKSKCRFRDQEIEGKASLSDVYKLLNGFYQSQ